MKKRMLSLLLALGLLLGLALPAWAAAPYLPFTMGPNETANDLWQRIQDHTKSYTPGLLADGTPINQTNINRMIDDMMDGIPSGSTWDKGNRFDLFGAKWPAESTGIDELVSGVGACNSYARLASDYIFGYNAPVSVHKNFQDIKPGDLVYEWNSAGGHWFVVAFQDPDAIEVGYTGLWHTFSGNSNSQVFDSRNSWVAFDSNLSGYEWSDVVRNNSCVITRYGDEVGETKPSAPVDPAPVQPAPQPPAGNATFSDVPASHWAYSYIERAADNGWVSGVGNGLYMPEKTVSYAELAVMVTNISCPADVAYYTAEKSPGDPWYQPYLLAADGFGLWYETKLFENFTAANEPMTRYEMAVFLSNAYGMGEYSAGFGFDVTAAARSRVGDWDKIPAKYRDSVAVCIAAGLLSGVDSAGTFAGDRTVTRAQAAVIVCGAAEKIGKLQVQF